MTKEIAQETVGVEDEEALQRAAIEELYQEKKQEKQKFEENTDKEQSDSRMSSFVKILSILYNPRKFGGEVTGLETKPSIPDNIDDVVDITADDIEKIRFEIDGEYDTDWYSWGCNDLDNIIDYYADGDISKFISDTNLSYDVVSNSAYIRIPDNINSRTSIIKERLSERQDLIDDMGYSTFKTYSKLKLISYLSFYSLTIIGIITSIIIRADIFTVMCISLLVFFIHIMVGTQLSISYRRTYDPIEHLKPAYEPIIKLSKYVYNKIDTID